MIIDTIAVEAEYCFGDTPITLGKLGRVNFVFAPNGSGKTTISNALSNQPTESTERTSWAVAKTDLPIRVFNEAYRSRVLRENVDGIFTIGEENIEINATIAEHESKRRKNIERIESLLEDISSDNDRNVGLEAKIAGERAKIRAILFEEHKKFPKALIETVFQGFRANKENFLKEALRRFNTLQDLPTTATLDELELRARSLRGDKLARSKLPRVAISSIISPGEILDVGQATSLSGSGALATLIQQLSNEDWVSTGRRYIDEAAGLCPFCQQIAPTNFNRDLEEYFAKSFDSALGRANEIKASVDDAVSKLKDNIQTLEMGLYNDPEIDVRPFTTAIATLRTAAELVFALVLEKSEHPTRPIVLSDVAKHIDDLNALIDRENLSIDQHNSVVTNSFREKRRLVDEGWAMMLNESSNQILIKRFTGETSRWAETIKKKRQEITERRNENADIDAKITGLRSTISNTNEVAERINRLLRAMGFHRFSLIVCDEATGSYRIVRSDGTTAIDSLSEGEKSFICFTYFWESLFGAESSGNNPEDAIAVIDDPISSLDSDTLFIVAAHIRSAARDIATGKSNLRQLIVLTHNTQFHNESAYSTDRNDKNRQYFRLLKGANKMTTAINDGTNTKIRGSYSLLWDAVVDAATNLDESAPVHTGIVNIVRRIVEGYFKAIGTSKGPESYSNVSIVDEKIISMFHIWSNAGSHTIIDDIDQATNIGGTKRFLMLFQQYFGIVGHAAHFDMMVCAGGGADLLKPGNIFSRE